MVTPTTTTKTLYSCGEAARELNCAMQTLRKHCRRAGVVPELVGGYLVFTGAQLETLRQSVEHMRQLRPWQRPQVEAAV